MFTIDNGDKNNHNRNKSTTTINTRFILMMIKIIVSIIADSGHQKNDNGKGRMIIR